MAISLETLALAAQMKGGGGGGGSSGSPLPTVRGSDNGKVLTVKGGRWQAVQPAKELPGATAANNGKVLGIVNGAWSVMQLPVTEDELPAVTAADNGKVLGIVNGKWAAVEPSGTVVVAGEGTGSTVQGLIGNEGTNTNNTATGDYAHVEGGNIDTDFDTGEKIYSPNTASGGSSHAEGAGTTASGNGSHAEGAGTTASSNGSHAEGAGTAASGLASHAEGAGTTASGSGAHAEGDRATASGLASHAEGSGGTYTLNGTKYESGAKGQSDHTEGYQTLTAPGQPGNHAEGYRTQATGGAAHAEGNNTVASGNSSHAEGAGTTASGGQSHAEGQGTTASGPVSHAEGESTIASGPYSHAEGQGTAANHASQHVFGEYNVADPSTASALNRGTYVEIVGNGTKSGATESRSNARTLDWDGNEVLAGKLTVGAAPTANMDVATKQYVDGKGLPAVTASDNGKVLGVSNGQWTVVTPASGGALPMAAGSGANSVLVGNTSGTNVNAASGTNAVAAGVATTATHKSQLVFGEFNEADPSQSLASERGEYVEIVGNGYDEYSRANARTLDWYGNETLGGNITIQGGSLTLGNVTLTAEKLEALLMMVG